MKVQNLNPKVIKNYFDVFWSFEPRNGIPSIFSVINVELAKRVVGF